MTTTTRDTVVSLRKHACICALLAIAGALCCGCSLLTIESPAKPLSERELNARVQTRDFARTFSTTVATAADRIAASSKDDAVRGNALRWKVGATAASRSAATQSAPMIALVDSWALAAQMRQFFTTGAGATLFADRQAIAIDAARTLDERVTALAASLSGKEEFAEYRRFIERYVLEHPLTDLEFGRASVLEVRSAEAKDATHVITTVGTVPEVMSDIADRISLFGDQAPQATRWQLQLALLEAGYGEADLATVLHRLDAHLENIAKLAQNSPELASRSIEDLRAMLEDTTGNLDRSWALMMLSLGKEREALAAGIKAERVGLTESFDLQRKAITEDVGRMANEVTERSWRQLRGLVREVMLLAGLGVVVILGLPFAAGYLLGRAARTKQGEGVAR